MNAPATVAKPACAVCRSLETSLVAEIRRVPVHTTVLWQTEAAAQSAPLGDIDLTYCNSCGHLFNPRFEAAKTEYSQAYENSLHFSPLFQRYAESLADRLITRYDMRGKDVLEIGAGKGDFLALMVQRGGNRGVGYDPSYVPDESHRGLFESGRMRIVQEFYAPKNSGLAADLLVCRQVLEHIEEPRPFLERIRTGISRQRDTVVFFEVPNALTSLRDMDVWTLIYEHCGFYTPQSLGTLLDLAGFRVLSLDVLFEGIFLGVEGRVRRTPEGEPPGNQELAGLTSLIETFRRRFQEKVMFWQDTLRTLQTSGKRVVVWGGGARGVNFLNLVDTGRAVRYVVDINPRKAGTFASGTGQELVLPSTLRSYRPDVVVLMNPIYRKEIASMLDLLGLRPDIMDA